MKRGLGELLDCLQAVVLPQRCMVSRSMLIPGERCVTDAVWAVVQAQLAEGSCRRCMAPSPRGPVDRCPNCGRLPRAWDRGVRLGPYAGMWRRVIHAYKLGGRSDAAGWLAGLLAERVRAAGIRADWVVPVPQHWRRWLERGEGPVRSLCEPLAARLGLRVCPLLACTGLMPTRVGMSHARRLEMAEREFCLNRFRVGLAARLLAARGGQLAGRRVLLVDDVATSRGTLAACGRLLRRAGLGVDVAVLAATGG